jgi:amino acid permease
LIFLQFLYAEVTYFTKGKHRLPGYVEIFLGKKAKAASFLISLAAFYGTLLVYGLLGGLFLSNIFGGYSATILSLAFFVVGSALVLLRIGRIAEINFWLTLPLFGFIIYLLFVAMPAINSANFFNSINFSFSGNWFLPYGIWIFSLAGFSVIPETREIFANAKFKDFRRVIFASVVLSAIFYFLFITAVWGVGGLATTQDALSGLFSVLGEKALVIGSFIGFLAVFTSFMALAIDLQNLFKHDYAKPKNFAWFLTVAPPVGLFLAGATNFSKIISLIGALGLGAMGIFIVFMSRTLERRIKEEKNDIINFPAKDELMPSPRFLENIVLLGVFAGVIYELYQIFA